MNTAAPRPTAGAAPAGKTQQAAPPKAPARGDQQLGMLLKRRGVITEQQLAGALAMQQSRAPDKRLGEILVEQGYATERDLAAARAASVGLPFAMLTLRMVSPDAMRHLPTEFCEKHNLLPVSSVEDWLTVAMEEFTNVYLVDEVKRLSRKNVQVLAALGENIRQVRIGITGAPPSATTPSQQPAPEDATASGTIQSELDELLIVSAEKKEEENADLQVAAAGSPIVKLVNHIIKTAVESRASDIHIEPEENEFRIRYRIDGDLVPEQFRPSIKLLPAVVSRIKIIAGLDISERRLPQDGVVAAVLGGRSVELRVSTMNTPLGEKVVMRVVDNNGGVKKLEDLGFAQAIINDFRAAIREPHGMVLVTGPTGSGKSTTLYSAISEIINTTVNISTVEDPVERRIKGVNQFQINPKAGFTFAKALRALLRQDPDVIMVGEIRDTETAKLATEAALTGHLVLTTLHTNDSPSAVPRLVNMGVEPYLVAASLRAILSQRLVARLCSHCKRQVPIPKTARSTWERVSGAPCPIEQAFEGIGCNRCRHTGFTGRVAVHELLLLKEESFDSIGTDLTLRGMRQVAKVSPYYPLAQDCMEKIKTGQISIEALFELIGQGESGEVRPAAPLAA